MSRNNVDSTTPPFSPASSSATTSYQKNIPSTGTASPRPQDMVFFPRTGCFPCFFGLSPKYYDDGHNNHNSVIGSALRVTIVLFFWLFISHLSFQIIGNLIADGLKHFDFLGNGEEVPWYEIDPTLRVSTTISDSLRIAVWAAAGHWYKQHVGDERRPPATDDRYRSIDDGDESNIHTNDDEIGSKRSSVWPTPQWLKLVAWSTLAGPVRMGDTFASAGVFQNFWTPLAAYSISRIAALAIGAVPHCVGGIPSFTTSLGLGLFYAMRREAFERNVEEKAAAKSTSDGKSLQAMEDDAHVRNAGWGYKMQIVFGYAYFTCFMVLWDAQVLDSVLERENV